MEPVNRAIQDHAIAEGSNAERVGEPESRRRWRCQHEVSMPIVSIARELELLEVSAGERSQASTVAAR